MRLVIVVFTLLFSMVANATIDTYEFKDDATRERFQQLTNELRCPKCQNQNLAGSNSPIASDLRREIYRMVEDGQNDEQIVDFMVARYGEFVLYRPRVTGNTWVLWYGPFVLLAIGAVVLLILTRKRKKTAVIDETLNEKDKARLATLLDKGKSK
ncbi:cytochrome c-type biogenesis protein [Neptunomonas japonica]|uniref:cytochrome c-type biogenesis protein n=1 Tax=Neptunomonas japonica TaxID=417574 RepID=UPI0004916970|nr:cytochrome c-type biogenesis protein [Neptunomonas japonica]